MIQTNTTLVHYKQYQEQQQRQNRYRERKKKVTANLFFLGEGIKIKKFLSDFRTPEQRCVFVRESSTLKTFVIIPSIYRERNNNNKQANQ